MTYLQLDAELYSHSKEMFLFPQSLTSEWYQFCV